MDSEVVFAGCIGVLDQCGAGVLIGRAELGVVFTLMLHSDVSLGIKEALN